MYLNIVGNSTFSVALYVRLSKEDESLSESESIKNQKSILENYAIEQKLNVYNIYIDDGFSGGNYDRPAFLKMIKAIENKKVNMVITKDLSRLGRDYIQTGYYLEKYFPENNVRYVALLDNIDTGVENSLNDITPFKAIMNDLYAKDISKKIRSVKQDKIKKGKFIGGKAPYGYKKCQIDKNKIVIDEFAADIVKKIFSMALSGISCRAIALRLTEEGVEPPSVYAKLKLNKQTAYTNCWKSEVVTGMLKNEVYIGNMVQGRIKKINYKSKKIVRLPKDEWVIVKDTHEPIIDKEVYGKVQVLLENRSTVKTNTIDYSLKGVIYCKDCKKAMGIVPKKDKHYLRCRTYAKFTKLKKCTSHSIRADFVEQSIWNEVNKLIKGFITSEELIDIAKNIINNDKKIVNNKNIIEELRIKVLNITKDIDKIYMDKISNIIDEEDFTRIYNNKKIEKNKIQKKIKDLESNLEDINHLNSEKKEMIFVNEFINIEKYKKLIYTELIDKVEIGDNKKIYIFFKV